MSSDADVVLRVKSTGKEELRQVQQGFEQLSKSEQKAASDALKLAQAAAKIQSSTGNAAGAVKTLAPAIDRATVSARQYTAAAQQLIAAQNGMDRAAKSSGLAVLPRTIAGLSHEAESAAKGIIGLGAAFGAAKAGFDFFADSLELKSKIDQTNTSIGLQLRGMRDSGQVFSQAAGFANRYKLTQEETNATLLASVGILRKSTAGADDLLGVLGRLKVLSPEQGLEGAALALKELQSGSTVSLVGRFEVSRDAANKMKREIEGGADAVKVLDKYLVDNGVTMDALEAGAHGYAGQLKEAAQAGEQLKLAAAGGAGGAGSTILDLSTRFRRGLARAFGSDGGLGAGTQAYNQDARGRAVAQEAYNQALARGADEAHAMAAAEQGYAIASGQTFTEIGLATGALAIEIGKRNQATDAIDRHINELNALSQKEQDAADRINDFNSKLTESAAKSQIASAESQILKSRQEEIANASVLAAQGLLGSGDQALILAQKYGIARSEAELLINAQSRIGAAAGLADQRAGEHNPNVRSAAEQRSLSGSQRTAAAYARSVQAAQNQVSLASAKTNAQKIAILEREKAASSDVVERLHIQAQIESLRNSGAKAHTGELKKQLNLQEGIRDSLEKQYQSQLDASIALIEDRKQRRAEQREINQANRVLNTPGANADQKAAAADVLAEIPLQQERRRLAINEQLLTAGGKIINGKVYQSQPGAGGVGVGGAPLPAGVTGQAAGAQAPGGAGGPVVQFVVDGKVIAQAIIPYVTGAMVGGLRGAGAAGVGSRP